MLTGGERVKYFWISLIKCLASKGMACPSCGNKEAVVVDRKYVVTTLRRCNKCRLLFRAPTTDPAEFADFYQASYSEGFTTDMPMAEELTRLKRTGFKGSPKDYSKYIEVLHALGLKPGASLVDFGCSWGYASYQLLQAGFRVTGVEVSEPRRRYAREYLGIDAMAELKRSQAPYDVFFSAHVLEHVPRIGEVIDLARSRLGRGVFLAFTPNGASEYRAKNPMGWSKVWGFVHPLFLDPEYWRFQFRSDRFLIDSSPFDILAIATWAERGESSTCLKTDGAELMVAAFFD